MAATNAICDTEITRGNRTYRIVVLRDSFGCSVYVYEDFDLIHNKSGHYSAVAAYDWGIEYINEWG